ncbi:hypothetical protein [Actibacterium sp. 188UL27-1]|uniref:hypothetical protein n=1 Tax=Actibacterium sp. 188UL27-1 TaxID=2786961 RepID=UPI00195B3F67|nr:hypothetical protein [Actibacterium sp. 188UL27-1]MBM7067630.1 hypothetical protein [Actibacterium sp. 188UL27-1]
MTVDDQIRGLRIAAATVIAFGPLTMLAAWPPTALPIALFADILFWPLDGVQTMALQDARLLAAICGGGFVGWGLMMWLLAGAPYRAAPVAMRRIFLISVMGWFVIDGIGSVLAGAPLNVAANIGFLALFLWPLRREVQSTVGDAATTV